MRFGGGGDGEERVEVTSGFGGGGGGEVGEALGWARGGIEVGGAVWILLPDGVGGTRGTS